MGCEELLEERLAVCRLFTTACVHYSHQCDVHSHFSPYRLQLLSVLQHRNNMIEKKEKRKEKEKKKPRHLPIVQSTGVEYDARVTR
jgi:hypothetical protein